ncbi:hypothetical protein HK405_004695 [Cladochytrium tenue]|nr:hypothetical protein HK405_004695 [Cladochytrium tenue]
MATTSASHPSDGAPPNKDDADFYPPSQDAVLHAFIFRNDPDGLASELSSAGSSPHPGLAIFWRGHTPLTLAVSLGRKECVRVLLDAGASTLLKTSKGWSPYQEATSYGDREVMDWIFRRRRVELARWFQDKGRSLLESMAQGDRNEKVGPWEASVWNVDSFEFVNRVRTEHLSVNPLPAQAWHTRQLSILPQRLSSGGSAAAEDVAPEDEEWADEVRAAAPPPQPSSPKDDSHKEWSLAKRYFRELASFRGSLDPPPEPTVSFREFFAPARHGQYLHVGRPMAEKVSSKSFKATLWMYNGGGSGSKSPGSSGSGRYTPAVDVKALPGNTVGIEDCSQDGSRSPGQDKAGLVPSVLNWIGATGGPGPSGPPVGGPPPIQSPEFPLQISTLLPLLDLIGMGSNQHIRSLREFFNVQLPPGFPVKVEVPINLTPLSAVVTFQNIVTDPKFDPSIFVIPDRKQGYRAGEVIRGASDQP